MKKQLTREDYIRLNKAAKIAMEYLDDYYYIDNILIEFYEDHKEELAKYPVEDVVKNLCLNPISCGIIFDVDVGDIDNYPADKSDDELIKYIEKHRGEERYE